MVGDPEFQPQNPHPRGISISRLISAQLGAAEWIVRQALNRSDTAIELDGEPWEGDKFFIPRDKLLGKTISVLGVDRQWQLKYPESE